MRELGAILDAMDAGWPEKGCQAAGELLAQWCSRLGAPVSNARFGPNVATFDTEIVSICLRGMGVVPVLLVGGNGEAARSAIDLFRHEHWHDERRMAIAILATASAYDLGAGLLPAEGGLVMLASDLLYVLTGQSTADCTDLLRRLILTRFPFRRLIPFVFTRPVAGVMFVGRQTELDRLLHGDHLCRLVYGDGTIGKTSLLHQMHWELRRRRDPRAARLRFVDLYQCPPDADEAARRIAKGISPTSYAHSLKVTDLPAFLRRTRLSDAGFSTGPIELVLDEVDNVLANDGNCSLLRSLTHLQVSSDRLYQDAVRLTLCGRHGPAGLYTELRESFGGRLASLELDPLDEHCGMALLSRPLDHLGVRIEDRDSTLGAVLGACGGNPLCIHRWGYEIADTMADRPDRLFTRADFRKLDRAMIGQETRQ